MNEPVDTHEPDDIDSLIADAIDAPAHRGPLVTFGDGYIVLESAGTTRLELADAATLSVGGPEIAMAAAYACLGQPVEWVSTVGDAPLGRRVLRSARAANIGTKHIRSVPGRTGLKLVEAAVEPRLRTVVHDTAHSVFASRGSGHYDWPAILQGASALYVSGITLAASAAVRQDAIDAMTIANRMGLIVAFDLRYGEGSWSESDARRVFSGIVRHTDVLFADRASLQLFFGIDGSYDISMRSAIERLGVAAIAMRRERNRGNGRVSLEGLAIGKSGSMNISTSHGVEVADAGGADEAFAAGFLAGYLSDPAAIGSAVELGAAMSALVQTMSGEMLIATHDEIMALANAIG